MVAVKGVVELALVSIRLLLGVAALGVGVVGADLATNVGERWAAVVCGVVWSIWNGNQRRRHSWCVGFGGGVPQQCQKCTVVVLKFSW